MNTQHLRYAVEVEKTGSITQAAENLFMAQPNLSKAIKELEDTLGITVFERTTRGVSPTSEGREFLDYARKIIVQLDKMEALRIPSGERMRRQSLRVSIPRGSYISAGFAAFAAELDTDRGIDITIQETNSMQTIANVTDGGFNLGVIRYKTQYENYFTRYLKEKGLASETIWEFSCLALMPRLHPLAERESVEFDELGAVSVEIVHGDNVVPYLPPEEFKAAGTDFTSRRIFVYERGSQFELLAKVKNSFMWVSPIPADLAGRYGLVQRVCRMENNVFKDILIYPAKYKFTDVDRKFLNKMYEIRNEVAFAEYR